MGLWIGWLASRVGVSSACSVLLLGGIVVCRLPRSSSSSTLLLLLNGRRRRRRRVVLQHGMQGINCGAINCWSLNCGAMGPGLACSPAVLLNVLGTGVLCSAALRSAAAEDEVTQALDAAWLSRMVLLPSSNGKPPPMCTK